MRCPQRQEQYNPDQIINMPPASQRQAEKLDGIDTGNAIVLAQKLKVAEQVVQGKAPGNRPQRQIMPRQAQGNRAQHISRSEEHTSELQSLMRNSYAVFCLKKKKKQNNLQHNYQPTQITL